MKRIIFYFVIMLVTFNMSAQVSVGSYVKFPDNGLAGGLYKPQLGFSVVNNKVYLTLWYNDKQGYASFDNNSRILLKINDEENIKLPYNKEIGVIKDYELWSKMGAEPTPCYYTYSSYDISEEAIDKILDEGNLITKIRVVFANGDITDYDIKKNYRSKLASGLRTSYNEALKENKKRIKAITSDDDF